MSLAVSASVLQLPRVASEIVSPYVVSRVATEVTEGAEVGGLFLVDARRVLTQFGHRPECLFAHTAAVTTNVCVKRLVLLQTIAPRRAKRTVTAVVRSRTFVFKRDMLYHAAFLLTGESAVFAM